MILQKAKDILELSTGDLVEKRNLLDLIIGSKVKDSPHWDGDSGFIGNTPQQGIHWIGTYPEVSALIIKTKDGTYEGDGWLDDSKTSYQYSFKARNGQVNHSEKANRTLVGQVEGQYPIILLTKGPNHWRHQGVFSVKEIFDTHVILSRGIKTDTSTFIEDSLFPEGGHKYATHLIRERNTEIISLIKQKSNWHCDVCRELFLKQYGVDYIEAHHKVPFSSRSGIYFVKESDFALLCPNCHKAVHIYMRKNDDLEYDSIKQNLRNIIPNQAPQTTSASARRLS
jgi:putative restriction endonuclease